MAIHLNVRWERENKSITTVILTDMWCAVRARIVPAAVTAEEDEEEEAVIDDPSITPMSSSR